MEQTLSLIKPDAVERNLIGKIVTVFEENNLTIKEIKKIHVTLEFAQNSMKCIRKDLSLKICVVTLVQDL